MSAPARGRMSVADRVAIGFGYSVSVVVMVGVLAVVGFIGGMPL